MTDEGGFLKRAPTGFRWTVGAATSRPKAFPFRGRCPRRGRMRGTALIMQAVRFPRAAEGGGPYRRGRLMSRRTQAKRGPRARRGRGPGQFPLGLRAAALRRLASKCACGRDLAPAGQFTFSRATNGAAFYRGIPVFQSRRGGLCVRPGCAGIR